MKRTIRPIAAYDIFCSDVRYGLIELGIGDDDKQVDSIFNILEYICV